MLSAASRPSATAVTVKASANTDRTSESERMDDPPYHEPRIVREFFALSTSAIVNETSPPQRAMLPGMSVPKKAIGPHAIRSAVTPEIIPMDNSQRPTAGETIGPMSSKAPAPNPTSAPYLAIV